jgi:hypothetical protein
MSAAVQSATLFVRGSQSVRIVRLAKDEGAAQLVVNGPSGAHAEHVLESATEGLWYQVDIERRLVAEGFEVVEILAGDRRSGRDRRGESRGTERRRHDDVPSS